ncbi:MAG: hypothetical protein WCR04_03995, partial [Fibrobacteraceae bacterium]
DGRRARGNRHGHPRVSLAGVVDPHAAQRQVHHVAFIAGVAARARSCAARAGSRGAARIHRHGAAARVRLCAAARRARHAARGVAYLGVAPSAPAVARRENQCRRGQQGRNPQSVTLPVGPPQGEFF